MRETVRLGLRYINFFPFDIFEQLTLSVNVGSAALKNPETGFNTVFLHDQFRHFVQINNASIVGVAGDKVSFGSILDIDTSVAAKTADISAEAHDIFSKAHLSEKSVFFGLLKPDYVTKLQPEY